MLVLLLALLSQAVTPVAAPQPNYTIRAQDVLTITVWDQPELTNAKFTVDPDGTLMFPMIGRVKVAGLTTPQAATELSRRLADGYLRNPQVTVKLDQYRSAHVFVFGAVTAPGTYQLSDGMTIVEVLARAGYGTASEAVIVRTKGATGPVLPGENAASEVIDVNLRDLEKDVTAGKLSRNVPLMDNDTIYVSRTDSNRVFVIGEVRTPGAYSVPQGTTVLEVIQLAGGLTEHASERRIQLLRVVDGKRRAIKAKMTDVVNPGDTVVVPERFF